MALNSNISQLDSGQIIKRIVDVSNDAIRTVPAETTAFAIEIDATDGDTIESWNKSLSDKVSLTSASTGVVLAARESKGISSINLHTKTTSTIVGAQVCTLQYSPHDSDDIWINTSVTVTPDLTNGVVVSGTAITNLLARRVRVSIAAGITSGTFDLYLMAQGS